MTQNFLRVEIEISHCFNKSVNSLLSCPGSFWFAGSWRILALGGVQLGEVPDGGCANWGMYQLGVSWLFRIENWEPFIEGKVFFRIFINFV